MFTLYAPLYPVYSCLPFELQPTLSMSRGEAREAYLINRGKTLSPDGLNRKYECLP